MTYQSIDYTCAKCQETRDAGVSEEAPCAECGVCAVCAPPVGGTGGEDHCSGCFTAEVKAAFLREYLL